MSFDILLNYSFKIKTICVHLNMCLSHCLFDGIKKVQTNLALYCTDITCSSSVFFNHIFLHHVQSISVLKVEKEHLKVLSTLIMVARHSLFEELHIKE